MGRERREIRERERGERREKRGERVREIKKKEREREKKNPNKNIYFWLFFHSGVLFYIEFLYYLEKIIEKNHIYFYHLIKGTVLGRALWGC